MTRAKRLIKANGDKGKKVHSIQWERVKIRRWGSKIRNCTHCGSCGCDGQN